MPTTTKPGELTGDYVLDTARISFAVGLMTVAKVRGQFAECHGSAHLAGADLAKSSARLTIQAGSIQTHNEKRDDHLRGTFLDVPGHPTITATLTRVEQANEAGFQVTGDLTIRGVTKPVTVRLDLASAEHDERGDFRIRLVGKATIDRTDWGVRWHAVLEGGGIVVGRRVALEFDITAVRQP